MAPSSSRPRAFQAQLLAWFDRHQRELPWRRTRDPYAIWLSEVMLQQTTVPHATPYWLEFLKRWPTVSDLAAAPDRPAELADREIGVPAGDPFNGLVKRRRRAIESHFDLEHGGDRLAQFDVEAAIIHIRSLEERLRGETRHGDAQRLLPVDLRQVAQRPGLRESARRRKHGAGAAKQASARQCWHLHFRHCVSPHSPDYPEMFGNPRLRRLQPHN